VDLLRFYKYCPWDITKNEHIRDNLLKSILYFQTPTLLNDPFELFPSIKTDNTQQQMKKLIANFYKKHGWSKNKAQRFAIEELRRNPILRTASGQKTYSEEFSQGLRERVGICSFTAAPKNLLMWAHYADFHKGICLQFDFPESQSIVYPPPEQQRYPLEVYPVKVTYSSRRPKFSIFNMSLADINDLFLIKSEDWKYEDEYRAITPYAGCFYYPSHFLTGIIAGKRMDYADLEDLQTIVHKMQFQPQIYTTNLHNDVFGLTISKL